MRIQSWFAGRRELIAFGLTLLAGLGATPAALAAYWTVPVNYYATETIRYPLAISGAVATLPNLGRAGQVAAVATVKSGVLAGRTDSQRGQVAIFNEDDAPQLTFPYPGRSPPASEASLSLWVRLTAPGDRVIAARGDTNAGFTLHTEGGRLVFVYWDLDEKQLLTSSRNLDPGVWYNVIVTQSSGAARQGAYVAMYLNGVLEDSATADTPWGGLLGGVSPGVGTIGSAATSGFVFRDGFQSYHRAGSDKVEISGIGPFARANLADFRLFNGATLVCSDKTVAQDALVENAKVPVGTRCVVTSDVSSISQDRIEQASHRARLPFQLDLKDHNFQGLSLEPNMPNCPSCKPPAFVEDPWRLRQTVARFTGVESVQYQPKNYLNPLDITRWRSPYAVAMWVRAEEGRPDLARTLYAVGNETDPRLPRNGFHIYLHDDRIIAGVWTADCERGSWASAGGFSRGVWQHIAVSYDAPRQGDPTRAPNGLQIFLNGRFAASADTDMSPHGTGATPVSIGATGPVGACNQGHAASFLAQKFQGEIGEIKVLDAPVTAAQARQLASRYPNAYIPRYDSVAYPALNSAADPAIPRVPMTNYINIVPSQPNHLWVDGKVNPSLELRFSIDWSTPAAKWTGYGRDGQVDEDCEYMMGGVFWFKPDVPPEEPSSVLLCFSPKKIAQNIPPFSIGLFYPNYGKSLYLTVVDSMMPPQVLEKLKDYGDGKVVSGLRTGVSLDVGAYNMILQMNTTADVLPGSMPAVNYVSPMYQGVPALVRRAFAYENVPDLDKQVTFVWPWASTDFEARYVDQQQLLDDFDMQLSKDR